jgi:hypothetical protein
MDTNLVSLEKIRATLSRLRQDPKTKCKFPREIWDSIIQLTKTCPLEEVCHHLDIQPAHLKSKILQSKPSALEFQEISIQSPMVETVTISLSSSSGLKATVQGPLSCLTCLHQLFGR